MPSVALNKGAAKAARTTEHIEEEDDEVLNATGDDGSDDQRDDMNDSTWTSPIWFVAPGGNTQTFVWSANSPIYHDLNCWVAKSIGAANRRTGPPPAGKTKHAMPSLTPSLDAVAAEV